MTYRDLSHGSSCALVGVVSIDKDVEAKVAYNRVLSLKLRLYACCRIILALTVWSKKKKNFENGEIT